MKGEIVMKRKKGVALALALWASLAVMLIGTVFLTFSITQSRTTLGHVQTIQTLEFANAGIQYVINYMSTHAHWDDKGGIEMLVGGPDTWAGVPIKVSRNGLKASIYNTMPIYGFAGDLPCNWKIEVSPIMASTKGQPVSYAIKVTAQVGPTADGYIAGRQVTVRVRDPMPTDNALFIQNYRAWDVPGAPPPNNEIGTHDCVGFTEGFEVKGTVRIDGADPGEPSAATAGNANIWSDKARFKGKVSIQREKNVYTTSNPSRIKQIEKKVFVKGLNRGGASQGLPDVGKFLTLSGTPGKAEKLSRKSPQGMITIADSEITYDPANPTLPNIPTIRLTLKGKTIKVDRLRRNSKGQMVPYAARKSIRISDLKENVFYVKGGNVQIQGSLDGEQLTVVADENVKRNIYKSSITKYKGGKWPKPPEHLEREGNLSIIGDMVHSKESPSTLGIISKNHIFLNDMSFKKNNPLEVEAALMSYSHSVQFDWDNFSRNTLGKNVNLNDPLNRIDFKKKYKNGTFKLKGSIISKYADVEADIYGRGYPTQQMGQDLDMKNLLPPHFPSWSKAHPQKNAIIKFLIISYEDMGSFQYRIAK